MNSTISEILYPAYVQCSGVSKDTRTIEEGNMYFALKGSNFNGNRYAQDAIAKGASYVVLDERQPDLPSGENVIYVDNALTALQQLATYHRLQLSTTIIGLTGSNGKTTTKELLYAILRRYNENTYATEENFNNHIGVPLTILTLPHSAHFAIIEMGSNQPGDIEELCKIAQPDFGLITNIGKTHLEKLKSQEGVFEEKSSLFHWLDQNDKVFFQNSSDPLLAQIKSDKSIKYTREKTLESRLQIRRSSLHLSVRLIRDDLNIPIATNLFGEYNIENIAAAVTVAEYFSVPYDTIKEAIEGYNPSNMRSQIITTDENTIIVDAYNSNPMSLQKALNDFSKLEYIGEIYTNKIAIIGDMLELGMTSSEEHRNIINFSEKSDDVEYYFIGKEFESVATSEMKVFSDVDSCADHFKTLEVQKAIIFLKGSRGIKLEKLVPYF